MGGMYWKGRRQKNNSNTIEGLSLEIKYKTIERSLTMIRISKKAVEKLKESHPSSPKNSLRVFIKGIG